MSVFSAQDAEFLPTFLSGGSFSSFLYQALGFLTPLQVNQFQHNPYIAAATYRRTYTLRPCLAIDCPFLAARERKVIILKGRNPGGTVLITQPS